MKITKNSKVYWYISVTWLVLSIFGVISFVKNISTLDKGINIVEFILLSLNIIFIMYFWLNGIKDLVYVVFYYFNKNKFIDNEIKIINKPLKEKFSNPKVLLVYCTCDDFIKDSLSKSINQSYKNFETVILDDSKSSEYKNKVNKFASLNNIKVIRRSDRKGFKAGNLNNFLKSYQAQKYDFFVILDSDEIIPNDFISKSLHYFSYYKNLGILQATHVSTRNVTKFMKRYSPGVDAHWPTYQTIKEKYGFMSFLGHGAMISKECFNSVGKFPELVAEDISFSIEARHHGYMTGFSNLIVCQEQYPIDYYAFKKRHLKWTGGNLEFIKTYSKYILKSREIKWYEKLDLFLFTYSLPMSSVFFVFLVINLILLPYLGYNAGYPGWLMVPTTVFLFAPTLNDMVYLIDQMSAFSYFKYLLSSFLLYGSLYWLSFYGASKAWIGIKPKFIVTPKNHSNYSFMDLFLGNIQEIIFSIVISLLSIYFTGSIMPVILIVIPSLSGFYITSLYKKIDYLE